MLEAAYVVAGLPEVTPAACGLMIYRKNVIPPVVVTPPALEVIVTWFGAGTLLNVIV
jgi:hypothetical protein